MFSVTVCSHRHLYAAPAVAVVRPTASTSVSPIHCLQCYFGSCTAGWGPSEACIVDEAAACNAATPQDQLRRVDRNSETNFSTDASTSRPFRQGTIVARTSPRGKSRRAAKRGYLSRAQMTSPLVRWSGWGGRAGVGTSDLRGRVST